MVAASFHNERSIRPLATLKLPSRVASVLAHALVLAASGSLKEPISMGVDENLISKGAYSS